MDLNNAFDLFKSFHFILFEFSWRVHVVDGAIVQWDLMRSVEVKENSAQGLNWKKKKYKDFWKSGNVSNLLGSLKPQKLVIGLGRPVVNIPGTIRISEQLSIIEKKKVVTTIRKRSISKRNIWCLFWITEGQWRWVQRWKWRRRTEQTIEQAEKTCHSIGQWRKKGSFFSKHI